MISRLLCLVFAISMSVLVLADETKNNNYKKPDSIWNFSHPTENYLGLLVKNVKPRQLHLIRHSTEKDTIEQVKFLAVKNQPAWLSHSAHSKKFQTNDLIRSTFWQTNDEPDLVMVVVKPKYSDIDHWFCVKQTDDKTVCSTVERVINSKFEREGSILFLNPNAIHMMYRR